jgi:hypothetical protein
LELLYAPHAVVAAAQWHDEIGRALARCDWFIVLLTPRYRSAEPDGYTPGHGTHRARTHTVRRCRSPGHDGEFLARLAAVAVLAPVSFAQNAFATIGGDAPDDRFGSSVAGVGDLDGDSVPDFMVAAAPADPNGANSGRVRVYSGAHGALLFTFGG